MVGDLLLLRSLSLHLVDGLHEYTLVLEHVTLGLEVQLMVAVPRLAKKNIYNRGSVKYLQVLVDGLVVTEPSQETSENSLSSDPQLFGVGTCVS